MCGGSASVHELYDAVSKGIVGMSPTSAVSQQMREEVRVGNGLVTAS